ncbi:sigma-70 family RNA polymerase sigma factor [candidate division KSB1 bacterium]|nr:sigma-70 family RNA polymerase sigma factor [candidate division KSB1 bacterium]
MSDVTDKDLIDAILAGNQRAFEEFMQRYKNLVRHIIVRMIANTADREDLGQEVFFKIYHNLGTFRFASKVSTWVAKIAHNACVNYLQKKKIPLLENNYLEEDKNGITLERFRGDGQSPLESVEQENAAALIQAAIEQLPVHYRSVITLYHLHEMSYAEISEIMGLPEGTVKSYLFRARKILRHKLARVYAEEAAVT